MIKKGDSVKLDYIGKAGSGVFDTTVEEKAKESGIYDEKGSYGPVTVIVGAGHVLKGLDKAIVGKKKGDEFKLELGPEEGFGKRDAELIKLVPTAPFKRDNVTPKPGMIVNVDGSVGAVKSVSGGRVVVDFNHPLAGRKLDYEVWVRDVLKTEKEKLEGLFRYHTGKEAEVDGSRIIFEGSVSQGAKKRVFDQAKKHLGKEKIEFVEIWK